MDPSQLLIALLAWPMIIAGLCLAVNSNRLRPWLVPIASIGHLLMTIAILRGTEGDNYVRGMTDWLVLDPLGKWFLGYVSVFFLIIACYAPGYLAQRQERTNRWLCACVSASLGIMTLVILSHHLGLMWVAMEGTTLVTVPSLYFNNNPRSLEATWKYLLVCSFGIAIALLGSFFLAYSALHGGGQSELLFDVLVADAQAGHLSLVWFHAAFVLLMVGYGTKMGLSPMHTWKPDAYGEAPGMIGALMAGGQTSCAFLAILRIYEIAVTAHDETYVQRMMIFMGLLSMITATLYMARQRDIKRLLAYSSVEHMGMLIFGIGIGGVAQLAALTHVVHNGLTKGILFLSVANIHRAFGSKSTDDVKGAIRRLPFSGVMLLIGFFAITGSPPFAPFISEFQMIRAAFAGGHWWAGGLFVACMLFVFFGMGHSIVMVCFGQVPRTGMTSDGYRDNIGTGLSIAMAFLLILLLGVYSPPDFLNMLEAAGHSLRGTP